MVNHFRTVICLHNIQGETENCNATNLTNIYIQINSHPKLYYSKCVLSITMQLHYITLP